MSNPTMIRHKKISDDQVVIVITTYNLKRRSFDARVQTYNTYPDGRLALIDSELWNTETVAINRFNELTV